MDCSVPLPQSSAVTACPPVASMVDYEQAQSILSALIGTLPDPDIEYKPIDQADGSILARDLRAANPRPEADISAMDGYAFGCADIPAPDQHNIVPIPLRDYVVAGDLPQPHKYGTAATILTGARLPAGADCVVARERVEVRDGIVHIAVSDIIPGKNIRRAGEEFPAGTLLLAAGQKLDWRDIALLASQNIHQVAVYKPLQVGIIASGAEFAQNAADCRAEVNTPLLGAMLTRSGVQVLSRVVGSDNPQELLDVISELAAHSDILVTTGGISVGQTDNVLPVMEQLGATCLFRRVKMRPGKPFTLMQLGTKPVFCLPGNPGATAICAQLFVLPFLHTRMGRKPAQTDLTRQGGRSSFTFSTPPDAACFVPVTYTQSGKEGVFSLVVSQGASDITCFSRASGLMHIPAGHTLNIGDWYHATLFHAV